MLAAPKSTLLATPFAAVAGVRRNAQQAVAAALSDASRAGSPSLGAQIHSRTFKLGLSWDTFTQNNLLCMYSRCRLLGHARQVFDEMPERNDVSWTALLTGLMQNGDCPMGFQHFVGMMRHGFFPNQFALASVIGAHATAEMSGIGVALHCLAVKSGLERNAYVGTSLLLMYARLGDVEGAEEAFQSVERRDLACCNAMVEAYVLNSSGHSAMQMVTTMHRAGIVADEFSFIGAMKGCAVDGNAAFGRQLHGLIIQNAFESNTDVMNALVDLYFGLRMIDTALAVFSRIRYKDTVSWNTVVSAFSEDGDEQSVADFFSMMLRSAAKPNQLTFSVVLKMCSVKENLPLGLQVFGFALRSGCSNDPLVVSSSVNMLSRCCSVSSARALFLELPEKNIVTWNAMIMGHASSGYSKEALRLFRCLIRSEMKPDDFTYTAVLSIPGDHRGLDEYEQIHANILKSGFASCPFVSTSLITVYTAFGSFPSSFRLIDEVQKDLVSWGVIISAFLKENFNAEVLVLFYRMRDEGMKPDEFILGCALNACANAAIGAHCRSIHPYALKTALDAHICVAGAIVDAYAKCGDIVSSKKAFSSVLRGHDAILFNTMITAYAHHGMIKEALELCTEMKQAGIDPTPATYVAMIKGCSHCGLVEQGERVFASVASVTKPCLSRDIFASLVDLLARDGLLREAKAVIESMPYEPWPAVWRSLMHGCRIHGNKELSGLAAEQIMRLAPASDGAYVALANTYSEMGQWEDAVRTRMTMRRQNVHKLPGNSMTV